jgi:nucleoside 2-deoxyribosyltransferase
MREYLYVIIPISSDNECSIKKEILKRISNKFGVKVHFPFEASKDDSSTVFSEVSGACFVFVDLSFERPSCYYELGVAQALGKTTFIVARVGTTIHQAHGDVHYYNDLQQYESLVKKSLTERNP